jgi:3-methyladenine DNA glycosylase AlkD
MTTKDVLSWLSKTGTKATRDGMARYGIVAKRADGVPMGVLLKKAKEIGTDQKLSLDLWDSGHYEARLLAALIGDPARVTPRQFKAWGESFENWADGDTACFKLLDRSPHAWDFVPVWARSPRRDTKRAAFALLASLALHDKKAADERFLETFTLLQEGAGDERMIVAKGVSWALRSIGRRNATLRARSLELAKMLASSTSRSARFVGNDARREFEKLAAKKAKSAAAGVTRKKQPPKTASKTEAVRRRS